MRAAQRLRALIAAILAAVADATAIEVPKLAEAKRVSWVNLVFGVGTVIGIWVIIGVRADVSGSLDVIKGASWVAKGLLFVAAIGFTAGDFHAPESSGSHQTAIWVIIGILLAAGVAATLITVIPRLRRLATARVRPHLVRIWAGLKTIATEPRKIVYVLAGSVLGQVFVALALGAALHAIGEQASLATLLVVITAASMTGGTVPVPGGAGVVEAGLIAGLTSAGVPEDAAVAALLIQRFFTAYLPPIWGWITLTWMRRREYV
jgi:uncharacterized membrane protein YbhN (UPF0104 family)